MIKFILLLYLSSLLGLSMDVFTPCCFLEEVYDYSTDLAAKCYARRRYASVNE